MMDMYRYAYQIDRISEEQKIPQWARAEHLERIIPEGKLWKLAIGKKARA